MAKTTKKKNKISVFDVVNLIAMILVGLIMLMPILNLAAKAFSSEGNVIAGKVLFWPLGLQTGTIKYVLTTPEFGTSFLVTVTVTITGTIGAMLLTVMATHSRSRILSAASSSCTFSFLLCCSAQAWCQTTSCSARCT